MNKLEELLKQEAMLEQEVINYKEADDNRGAKRKEKELYKVRDLIAIEELGTKKDKCNNPSCNRRHISCKKNYYDESNIVNTLMAEKLKKDKVIDVMAEMITEAKFCYFKKEDGGELLGKYRCYTKDEWIDYFTKKTEEK